MIKMVQGHRGSSELYPENTMLAFRKAVEEGANGVEMDVRMSVDGELVIMHNRTVDKTTNGTGEVHLLTYRYLSGLDAGAWKGAQFAGREDTRIPRLADVLDEFNGEPVFLILQMYVSEEDALKVYEIVRKKEMVQQTVFFGGKGLYLIKSRDPESYCHNDGMPDWATYVGQLDRAIEERLDAVSVHAASPYMDKMAEHIHSHGKAVHCSYLSDDYAVKTIRLIDMGVDFILGDNCAAMMEVIRDRKIRLDVPDQDTFARWRELATR